MALPSFAKHSRHLGMAALKKARRRPFYYRLTTWTSIAVIGLGVLSLGVDIFKSDAPKEPSSIVLSLPPPSEAPQQETAAPPPQEPPREEAWEEVKVARGDSLWRLFKRMNLDTAIIPTLTGLDEAKKPLANLYPGQILKIRRDEKGALEALVLPLDQRRTLRIQRGEKGYQAEIRDHALESRIGHAVGTIDSSLFEAGQKAGLSDALIMALADIFAWDVDFALDIRKGDHFAVLYEAFYKEGEQVGEGGIVAAEFTNQGKTYRAVRYTDPQGHTGYYTPEGMSLKKAFLRTPVKFTRISSRFTLRRYHPILHRFRSHKGVDYAAPRGTPVKATGSGKVLFRGWKGGYGRAVILQHGERYTTLYGHLSRFAKGIRPGAKVSQGQVIGYVGSSGLATGPHLHYEFRIDGVHRNPLTVKLPKAHPIPKAFMADFTAKTRPLLANLDQIKKVMLALNP